MTIIKICGIVSYFNKAVSQLPLKSFSVYLKPIKKQKSINEYLLNVVPSQKVTFSLTCGYTHNLTSKGYIPTFKSLLYFITYLIKKQFLQHKVTIIYLQIGRDPTNNPYQLTKRSHTGLGNRTKLSPSFRLAFKITDSLSVLESK